MKWLTILSMSCLYLFSVLPNAFCIEKSDIVEADTTSTIVSTDSSGAPNAVLSSQDSDISNFEKVDGFTADHKPIKNGADGFTADHKPIKNDNE